MNPETNIVKSNFKSSSRHVKIAIAGVLMILMGIFGLSAEDRIITGVVFDDLDEPAIGASVTVPG